jgi:hypothetical protein
VVSLDAPGISLNPSRRLMFKPPVGKMDQDRF